MKSASNDKQALGINWDKVHLHEKHLRDALIKAHRTNREKKADYVRREYLRSYDARLVAAASAFERIPARWRPAVSTWPDLAKRADPWRGSDAIVQIRLKTKKSDPMNFRLVLNFPPEHRLLQHLVRNVLSATFEPHPAQFLTRGGSREALQTVATALKDGFCWAVETDIQSCYPSFDDSRIPELLPIPKEVTEHILLSRRLRLYLPALGVLVDPDDPDYEHFDFADEIDEVRRGIPQGSAASPIVAEMLLADIFPTLPKCGLVVNYADNFLILARTKGEAVSMKESLQASLLAHRAGPLRSKSSHPYAPGKPITFLGHHLTLNGGGVRIEPTPENLEKFKLQFAKLCGRVAKATSTADGHARVRDLKSYVRQWSSAFQLWDGASIHRERYLSKIPKP